ncbi:MAG: hypothetical protein FJZ96_00820 [Chloroflexi bacterium]|nr:hypothetical protein [Chloroflexota bacterium]
MTRSLEMVWLVVRRELRDQFRDWRIILPMVVLTVFFPFLMNYTARVALDFVAQYGTPLVAERLVPFFMMVVGFFPITVSLVIALESFVGEKERGTIEPLLSSPIRDWQLYVGKLISSSFPPVVTAFLGIAVYLAGLLVQDIPWPDVNMLLQTLFLTTAQAVLMVSGAMVISTQATTVRGANLLSSFIVVPMALLIQGESVLMFWGDNQVLWLAVLAVVVMTALLVRLGLAHFQRESLLGREIDTLNLRWMFKSFWLAFRGRAVTIGQWYRLEVGGALRRLAIPLLLTLVFGVIALTAGYIYVSNSETSLPGSFSVGDFSQALDSSFGGPGGPQALLTFDYILGHNIRAILMILLLGLFSFGVLGALAYFANFGLIGAVLALMASAGYSPLLVTLTGILPHGIFEIPALLLASAMVIYLGAALVTPVAQRTVGEVMIESLAAWAKVSLGVVVPLLVAAAAIEAYLTPVVMAAYLK